MGPSVCKLSSLSLSYIFFLLCRSCQTEVGLNVPDSSLFFALFRILSSSLQHSNAAPPSTKPCQEKIYLISKDTFVLSARLLALLLSVSDESQQKP